MDIVLFTLCDFDIIYVVTHTSQYCLSLPLSSPYSYCLHEDCELISYALVG